MHVATHSAPLTHLPALSHDPLTTLSSADEEIFAPPPGTHHRATQPARCPFHNASPICHSTPSPPPVHVIPTYRATHQDRPLVWLSPRKVSSVLAPSSTRLTPTPHARRTLFHTSPPPPACPFATLTLLPLAVLAPQQTRSKCASRPCGPCRLGERRPPVVQSGASRRCRWW